MADEKNQQQQQNETNETQQTENQQSTGGHELIGMLPDELKSEPMFATVKTVEDLAKNYMNAQKVIGGGRISVPLPTDPDEAWNPVWNKLGRPEKSDGYKAPEVDSNSLFKPDDAFKKSFFDAAHKHGLTQKQAANLYQHEIQQQHNKLASELTEYEKTKETVVADLRREWGDSFLQRDALAKNAVRVVGEIAFPGSNENQLIKLLDESGLGNHPIMIKAFAKLGEFLAEDDVTGQGAAPLRLSPKEAQDEIAKFKSNKEVIDALRNPYHPRHKEVTETERKLYQTAYPEPQRQEEGY